MSGVGFRVYHGLRLRAWDIGLGVGCKVHGAPRNTNNRSKGIQEMGLGFRV